MTHDLNAAIRRMRALLGVLDEDLATANRTSGAPLARAELAPLDWERAEAARRLVEDSLTEIERAAATASRRARSWHSKAELAVRRGDVALARQAMVQAETAVEEAATLTFECQELQVFLTEWAVRIPQPLPTTRPEAAG